MERRRNMLVTIKETSGYYQHYKGTVFRITAIDGKMVNMKSCCGEHAITVPEQDTKIATEQMLAESNLKQTKKICPLLRDYCSSQCECFVKAKFGTQHYSDGNSAEHLIGAYCDNAMFSGVTEVINSY